jgi:REP element-mobilizing transposase RayT
MKKLFRNKYRIGSRRLSYWDYGSNASYFVTICCKNKNHFFGEIVDGKMNLSDIGFLANKFWLEIPGHFPFVELGAFVVMPDHMHGIIIIYKTGRTDVATSNLDVATSNLDVVTSKMDNVTSTSAAKQKWQPQTLGVIVNQYKRIVTIRARKLDVGFAWQPLYYDHIIRNDLSFYRISKYIDDNPINWKKG